MLYPVLKQFSFTPGVTFDYRYQYLQGAPGSALATPLSGWSGRLTIASWDGLTTYLTLNSGAAPGTTGLLFGGDTQDLTNGIIDIFIASADTTAMTWRSGKYGLSLTNPGGRSFVQLYGSFTHVGFLPGT